MLGMVASVPLMMEAAGPTENGGANQSWTRRDIPYESLKAITIDDLLVLKEALWPHERLWSKQVEIAESVVRDKVTVVPAAHEVGKDYVAGFVVASIFTLCAALEIQCKIVTTSVTAAQLANLWGEIDRFIRLLWNGKVRHVPFNVKNTRKVMAARRRLSSQLEAHRRIRCQPFFKHHDSMAVWMVWVR